MVLLHMTSILLYGTVSIAYLHLRYQKSTKLFLTQSKPFTDILLFFNLNRYKAIIAEIAFFAENKTAVDVLFLIVLR